MTHSPSYPDEAKVGDPVGQDPNSTAGSDETKPEAGRTRHIVTGAAIGIGSAALVAALLYANRSRKAAKSGTPAISPFTSEGAD